MTPFYVLGIYLVLKAILRPTNEFFISLTFNVVAGVFMLSQYFWPSVYTSILTLMALYAGYLFVAGNVLPDAAYLVCVIVHAVFHDKYMQGENIVFNASVDALLHGVMFLLVSDSYKSSRNLSRFLRVVGVVNLLVAFLSLELKHSNRCDEWIFGLPRQPGLSGCSYWLGGYGAFATILLGVAALSAMLCLEDQSLSAETLFLEMCPYFIASTAFYLADPLWVTDLYEKIKCNQLYLILPSLFHLGSFLTKSKGNVLTKSSAVV